MLDVITRAGWGARYADGFGDRPLPAKLTVVHHSATIAPNVDPPYDDDDAAVRAIERIGQQRFGGGMPYPFLVTPSGRVYQGLSPQRRGAHLKGHNTDAVSICLVGNYTDTPPTQAQVVSVGALVRLAHNEGWVDELRIDGGHRDYASTACPGNRAYADLDRFRAAIRGEAKPVKAPERTERSPNFLPAFPLPHGHYFGPPSKDPRCHSGYYHGADAAPIGLAQGALRRRGWNITVDRLYGPATMRAVAAFQRQKGLAVDGLLGPVTWAAIDNLPITHG